MHKYILTLLHNETMSYDIFLCRENEFILLVFFAGNRGADYEVLASTHRRTVHALLFFESGWGILSFIWVWNLQNIIFFNYIPPVRRRRAYFSVCYRQYKECSTVKKFCRGKVESLVLYGLLPCITSLWLVESIKRSVFPKNGNSAIIAY